MMIVLCVLVGLALSGYLTFIITEDMNVKKYMKKYQEDARKTEWVNQLIDSIKDNEDELAY